MTNQPHNLLEVEYLRVGQMAAACRVSPRTVTKWCDRGLIQNVIRLPHSGDRRVHRDDFLTFLRQSGFAKVAATLDSGGRVALLVGVPSLASEPLKQVLTFCGFRVHQVESAVAAARSLDKLHPAAAVLHGSLGRASCRELCAELATLGRVPPRVILLVPADAEPGRWLSLEGVMELEAQAGIELISQALRSLEEEDSCTHSNGSGKSLRRGPQARSTPRRPVARPDPSVT